MGVWGDYLDLNQDRFRDVKRALAVEDRLRGRALPLSYDHH